MLRLHRGGFLVGGLWPRPKAPVKLVSLMAAYRGHTKYEAQRMAYLEAMQPPLAKVEPLHGARA